MIANEVLRAAARLWYLRRLTDLQAVPSPRPVPVRAREDGDADRVLMIGNGWTHGWGVVTQDLALAGQLERGLTARSGRTTRVRHIGAEVMNLAAAIPWLGDEDIDAYDLVVVVLSLNDAVRLVDPDRYEQDMRLLLARLRDGRPDQVPVLITAIPDVRSLPHYEGLFGRLAERCAALLNTRIEALAVETDGVTFLHLPAPEAEPGRPYGSPGMYSAWSEAFATASAPLLRPRAHREPAEHEWSWAPMPRVLQQAAEGALPELSALAEGAKEEFGADLAFVSLVDGGRQHYLVNTAQGADEVPLELAHCRLTMQGDDMVVVKNSFTDPRVKGSPLLDVTQFRFYAGVPLKDASGTNIGTFCVISVLPHGRHHVAEERLRRYADAAEQELQRLGGQQDPSPETSAAVPTPAMIDA